MIPFFATNALDDIPLPLYRQSQNRREWLHVDDHCRAIEAILLHGRIGETYNVGSSDERSVDQIADAVLGALGKPPDLRTYVHDRPGHDRRYLLDDEKISRELDGAPRVRFEEGIHDTISWYGDHREWWGPKKAAFAKTLDETA